MANRVAMISIGRLQTGSVDSCTAVETSPYRCEMPVYIIGKGFLVEVSFAIYSSGIGRLVGFVVR